MSDAFKVSVGEKLLLNFDVAFNPGLVSKNKCNAFLTTRRLVVLRKGMERSFPLSGLKVHLKSWQGTGKIIELDGLESASIVVHYSGSCNNDRTEKVYNWLDSLTKDTSDKKALYEEIKSMQKSFKGFSINPWLGLDYKNPYTLSAIGIVFVSILLGGAIGAMVGFVVGEYVRRTGSNKMFSTTSKVIRVLSAIILGVVVYFVLAVILMKAIYFTFGGADKDAELQNLSNAKMQAQQNLLASLKTNDMGMMRNNLKEYMQSSKDILPAAKTACNDPIRKVSMGKFCSILDLKERCLPEEEKQLSLMINIHDPQLTKTMCQDIVKQLEDTSKSACSELEGSKIDPESIDKIRLYCGKLGD